MRFIAIMGTGMDFSEDINDNLGDYKVMSVEEEHSKFMKGGRGRRFNFEIPEESPLDIEKGDII